MSQYDEFAANYHWLYSDSVLSGRHYVDEHQDLLKEAGPTARILDCSCGIGTLPIALAKLGYQVSGSDGSPGMIEQASLAATNANVDIPFQCSAWEALPAAFSDRFDLVFCLGNSLGHTRTGEEMVRSLQGIRAVLRSGGKLVLDSRNWDQIRKHKTRFTPYQWRERAGQRCLPIYVWTFPERFEDPHTIDVLLVFDADGKVSTRSHPIVYYPFHFEELIERLRCAGFTDFQTRFSESREGYRVIAS